MIKTLLKLSAVCAVVLLSTAMAARASMLSSGSYTNLDMQAYVSLWDISGDYSTNISDLGSAELTLQEEPSGKYSGIGTLDIEEYGISGDLTVSGDVSGSGKKPSMSMKLDFSTTDQTVDSIYFKSITEVFNGKFSFDLTDSELIGSGSATVKAVYLNPKTNKYESKSKSEPIKDQALPMASDTTGQWALVLSLTDESDTKYSGSASIITSAGNSVDFTVTGTYSAKTDKSTLKLKGPKGSDCDLTLVISDEAGTFDSIDGKAFGQTLSYKAPKE